jgi:hypothetical protein
LTSFDGTGLTHNLPIDAEIFTTDGDKIGTVREIRGSFFKVNAAMQPDYWLPMHTVSSVTGGRVLLNFDKNQLGEHKTDNPLAA